MYRRPTKTTALVFLLLIACAPVLVVAQTATENAARIRELRAEIKKREQPDVPVDVRELNRAILLERRAQLRTALRVEIENLQRRKADLDTFATDEEKAKIASVVEAYEKEIQKLGQEMTADLVVENSSGTPGVENASGNGIAHPTPTPQASPSPAQSLAATALATPTPSIIPPVSTKSATGPAAKVNCGDFLKLNAAQKNAVPQVEHKICDLVRVLRDRRTSGKAELTLTSADPRFLETPDYFDLLAVMIAKKSTPAFLVEAVEADTSTQVGSEPSTGGTTSLVVKGGTPAVLGFAVENGALTRNVDKTIVTFRGNPIGVIHALKNDGFFQSAIDDEKDPLTNFLRKTSFAFSFDTSRGTEPGVFTGTKQQLSSFSGRIEFVNKRKPSLYVKEWNEFLSDKVVQFADTLRDSKPALVTTDITSKPLEWRDPALQQWFADTQAALAAATTDNLESVLRDRLDKLPIADLSPATVAQLSGIEQQIGTYISGRDEVLDKIARGTLITFEYTNKREVNAPDTSNFRFIAEKGTGGRVDVTFNASLTMFNNLDALKSFVALNPSLPKPRRLRDFQFAGQLDVPFGSVRDFGQFVLFAGGRYQRLLENATTDLGAILPNTKGDIGFLQLGLKVPIKGTGFKIPFSVTFANRTELVKERTIRGNFGFTLDLDTLLARFKPF
jgi:hypothetical protein